MGVRISGMDNWLHDLETLRERADVKFPRVMGRAGMNMKADEIAQYDAMPHRHIPHLRRAVGYDVSTKRGPTYSVVVGIAPHKLQARLASFIEYGTLTSRPHPVGEPALNREAPKMMAAAEQAAVDLLEGKP